MSTRMSGAASHHASGKYDQVPGPLGMDSASLKGKVALVTGAGTYKGVRCFVNPVHFPGSSLIASEDIRGTSC